jgi:hypothetical protein
MQYLVVCFLSLGLAADVSVNPIQKVLELMEDLRKKVLLDGEVEQKQFEKYGEWCKDEAVSKQYEIKTAEAKVEDYTAVIAKETATILDADSTIGDMAKVVARNEQDLAAATEIRDKEHADFEASDAELAETVDMLGRAIGIIAKEMRKSSFAQISKTAVKQLVSTLEVVARASVVSQVDQDKLNSFIQAAEDDGDDFLSASAPDAKAYESQSGSILDVLEDMKEKAMALKNDAEKAEMKSQHSFEMLAQSIKGELAADNKELNAAKTTKAASSEVKATAEADLGMTEKMLAEAKTYLGDLSQDCQTKAADWEVSQKARAEELQALSDALKIIKEKTGGATSRAYDFFEVKAKSHEMSVVGGKVLDTLRRLAGKGHNADVALSQLSLQVQTAFEMSSGADVFGKVKSMITEMIDKLVAEAAEEADHKAWCDKEMSEAQEKIADHTSMVDKLSSKIDKASASIAQITESVAELQAQLADIAKQQATMDEMRAEEKAAYVKAKKDYEDGVEGLTMALEILREYYSAEPALLQQPSVSTHSASGDAATGIIGILEVSQSDFSKLLADANVEEETAVKEYEKVSHENAVQRTMKEQDVKYQLKEKASLEKNVADFKEDRSSEQAELDAVLEYFAKVKPGCTTKPMTYAERKQRRENEIAGLKEALTILDSESPAAFLAIRTARRVA